ncbi:MAG TPA: DNA translocase FtsK 4TM domain-containing protein [Methylophilaceae bacterium]|jgi:S-DNA-T family DNA segregation ATPase FtsK/SpoIIIE
MLLNKTPPANTRNGNPEKSTALLREAGLFARVVAGLFLAAILYTYHPEDPGWSHSASNNTGIHNFGGTFGAWVSDILLYLFGISAWWWVSLILMGAWWAYKRIESVSIADRPFVLFHWCGFALLIVASCALEASHLRGLHASLPLAHGGMLGVAVDGVILKILGYAGGTLALLLVFAVGFSLYTGLSWLDIIEKLGTAIEWVYEFSIRKWQDWQDRKVGAVAEQQREEYVETERKRVEDHPPVQIEAPVLEVPKSDRIEKERQSPLFQALPDSPLPPLHLLDEPQGVVEMQSAETLEFTSRLIERKLMDFNVEVKVTTALPGPVITRYEFEPAAGIKGSQITNLSKDLARALSVISVRVVETIPGKNCMGLEIPNPKRQTVSLTEILGSQAYADMNSPLTIALGKDISGKPSVADLAKMPHVLVAGTTGSGKSVAINAMILSLLYKADASVIRLILVDPKMLELSVYEGIPHLLAPVVTDMRQAANALNWCVTEMDKRYRLMATFGVRNLAGFNQKLKDAQKAGEPLTNPFSLTPEAPELLEELPLIVVVIDELADMMMVVGKKVEELIARLAQKARASGIHLILATQRPSVDVITGLIKANIPTRIAFQVSSKIDSRTILDQMGAEALLGQGDMLYQPPGTGYPLRVHGAFVSDNEVHRVVEYLKQQGGEPNYIEGILTGGDEGGDSEATGEGGSGGETDPLYDEAVAIVLRSRRASISSVQRHLRIGYNRAARLIEDMERAGLVSAMQSNGNREVLAASNE